MPHDDVLVKGSDGAWYAQSESATYAEPVLVRQRWFLPGVDLPDSCAGGPARYAGDGLFSIPDPIRGGSRYVRLRGGGSEPAAFREEIPLILPRGFPSAVWKDGSWRNPRTGRSLGIGRENRPKK